MVKFVLALLFINTSAISKLPSRTARCNGANPSGFYLLILGIILFENYGSNNFLTVIKSPLSIAVIS